MLYPLKFDPILKDKIWGGAKLQKLFNKQANSDNVGESWELSGYEGDESVVNNGFLAGNTLTELIEVYMGELIGDKVFDKFGLSFPLLFKLIDADDDLSIQVHPNDETAASRHNSFGKTEMWYVLDAEPGAELIVGFNEGASADKCISLLEENRIEEILQHVPVKKGDVFFIPAGLVHGIGKGVLVAEIQESSDITYRIYDYHRKDDKGNERELHVDQALDVIDFDLKDDPKVKYTIQQNQPVLLVTNEYFTTNIIEFDKEISREYASIDSFVVYMCVEGSFEIGSGNDKVTVEKGETVLIPAIIDNVTLYPQTKSQILEVYIG